MSNSLSAFKGWTNPKADEDLYEFLRRHKHLPVPGGMFASFWKMLLDRFTVLNEKNLQRNQRLDALEARVAAQDERIAELDQRVYKGVWQSGES